MGIGSLISIVILILSFIISILIVKKFAKTKVKRFFLFVFSLLFTLIGLTFCTITMENLLLDFDTAESIFYFNHSEEFIDVVDGNSSAMIIYKVNKNTLSSNFVKKNKDGYKISNYFFNYRKIKNIYSKNISLVVYNVPFTDDYYICGFVTTDNENFKITNSNNLVVDSVSFDLNINNQKQITFYDYIGNYETDDYYLIINDEKIMISEKTQSDNSLVTTESR